MGIATLAEDGTLPDCDPAEVQVRRAMMACARHDLLVLDNGKFGRIAPVRLACLGDMDTIVTDAVPVGWLAPLCATRDVDPVQAEAAAQELTDTFV